jgi:hypothetical protein
LRNAAARRRGAGDAEDEAAEAEAGGEDKEDTEEGEARPGSAGTEANLERSPEVLEKAWVRL